MKQVWEFFKTACGFIFADLARGLRGFRIWGRDLGEVTRGFHVKQLRFREWSVILTFLVLVIMWIFGIYNQLSGVKESLSVGKEFRLERMMNLSRKAETHWESWLYCREILELEPGNSWALAGRERIQAQFSRKARRIASQGRFVEAIPTMVRAIQVDPEAPGLWSELELWVRRLEEG